MPRRRSVKEIAKDIVDECAWGKMMSSLDLTDYDPLVVIMHRVAEKIRDRGGSFDKPKARKVWCEVMKKLQENNDLLEHNSWIPCRRCNQEFWPVIDEGLLTIFLAWYESSFGTEELLAIHRCPACGGEVNATHTAEYKGDYHTPPPGSVKDDDEWTHLLLSNSRF